MSIILGLIVKNESHIIEKTLESIYKYIDFWIISDTGSTDNTKEVIEKYFKKKKIPGILFDSKWEDFATNRNNVLEKARNYNYDFLWMMDADDPLVTNEKKINLDINVDGYYVKMKHNKYYYRRIIIFNNKRKWYYRCVVHEYPELNKINKNIKTLEKCYINYTLLGSRTIDKNKYQKDAKIIDNAIKNIKIKDIDLLSRYWFYLARSYDPFDKIKAYNAYKKRLKYNGNTDENFLSCIRIINLIKILKKNTKKIPYYCEKAIYYNNKRAIEAKYELLKYYNEEKISKLIKYHKKIKCDIPTGFLVNKDIYDYLYEFEILKCYQNIKDYEIVIRLSNNLLNKKEIIITPIIKYYIYQYLYLAYYYTEKYNKSFEIVNKIINELNGKVSEKLIKLTTYNLNTYILNKITN